jgi:hypothetical protein
MTNSPNRPYASLRAFYGSSWEKATNIPLLSYAHDQFILAEVAAAMGLRIKERVHLEYASRYEKEAFK